VKRRKNTWTKGYRSCSFNVDNAGDEMLDAVIGQSELKKSIDIAIVAARYRKEVFGHILMAGQGGLGKTHILIEICKELGYRQIVTQGNRLTPVKVKNFLIDNCQELTPAFLIIDEIHEMSDDAQEELYWPMDKNKVLTLGEPVDLGPFCLAGTTTDLQELNGKSLVNRFIHFWELKELPISDLMLIIGCWFLGNGILIKWELIKELACRCRGIPRLALKYARRVRDFAQYEGRDEILIKDIERMFSEVGIDKMGLDVVQRKYLQILHQSNKPIGKDALASMLGEISSEQLNKLVEPYLWRIGFITSSSRGRELTGTGSKYLDGFEKKIKELVF